VPDPFPLKGVGANQLVAQHVLKNIGDHRTATATRCNRYAIDSLVGPESNDADLAIGWAASQTVTPNERGIGSGHEDIESLNFRYTHVDLPRKRSEIDGTVHSALDALETSARFG
jgi:hypothetical protein